MRTLCVPLVSNWCIQQVLNGIFEKNFEWHIENPAISILSQIIVCMAEISVICADDMATKII